MSGVEGLKAAGTLASQIVTLSSALIGLTVTFVDKFSPVPSSTAEIPGALMIAWLSLLVCVFCGLWTGFAVTGSLNEIDSGVPESNPKRWNVKIPTFLMQMALLVGVAAMVVAGWGIVQR